MNDRLNRLLAVVAGTAAACTLSPASAQADITGFTSPSGNIGCMLDVSYLRCDIRERDWSPPPKPADCPAYTGFGQGIILRPTGTASFVCAGDTALGGGPALEYGQYRAGGGMSCNSEPSGMTCSNSDGHGFTISREGYQLF